MTSSERLPGASTLLTRLPGRQGFGDASLIKPVPGSIDLGGGNPDKDLLPVGLYRDAVAEHLGHADFASTLGYVPAPGTTAFRAILAAHEGVDPERIVVTAGGTHGLALAVLGTVEAGDTIVVDDPVYPLFLRILDLLTDVTIVSVGVGPDGLDVDELEALLAQGVRPRALFTVPTFHNPSGAVLTQERAQRITQLAEKYGFTVFADDPYKELAFPGAEAPALSWLRDSDRVIGVHTFSKTLGPALRLGWIVVPEHLSAQYVKLRNRLDGQTSGFLQEIVGRMIVKDEFGQANRAAGEAYARKCHALASALHRELPGELDIIDPRGGFFLWARFRDQQADFAKLFNAAQDEGVVYQRGEWFGVGDPQRTHGSVRLTFSELDIPTLEEGAARLARAWRSVRS